jgi:hypothetical protein
VLSSIARYAIIVYAVFAALTQLGIAVQLTANTFLIVLGAVALAGALAFGIGGREVARDILEKAYSRSDEVTSGSGGGRPGRTTDGGDEGAQESERPQAHRLQRDEP